MRLILRVLFTIALLAVGFYALGWTKHEAIETSIDIDAPPERVWDVLTDFEAYPTWNPFIKSVEGVPLEGDMLKVTLQAATEDKPITFEPLVTFVDPKMELRWEGQLMLPKLFDGEHYFILEKTADGTRLTHGENFTGILLLMVDVPGFEVSFDAMNQALKQRVEAAN